MPQLIYFQSKKFWFYFAAVKSGSFLVYLSTTKKSFKNPSSITEGLLFIKQFFCLALLLVSGEKVVKQKERKQQRKKELTEKK